MHWILLQGTAPSQEYFVALSFQDGSDLILKDNFSLSSHFYNSKILPGHTKDKG